MGKLVILEFLHGSFETGFAIRLRIGMDGQQPTREISGHLPPSPQIPALYKSWQSLHWQLAGGRLMAPATQQTNFSNYETYKQAAEQLTREFKAWLREQTSSSFRDIREELRAEVSETESVRFILQAPDAQLRRLPWHVCDLFQKTYSTAELALSNQDFGDLPLLPHSRLPVRILVVLGNSQGINVAQDRQILEHLPNAQVQVLTEPTRQALDEQLWNQQGWDIVCFAGHSGTIAEVGYLQINQTESLTINQLQNALRAAIGRGLQLAIFNSCDGLALAQDLSALNIPQIIVMREPVPDAVAIQFLEFFLSALSQGESLYLALRQARDRLQALEDRYPCATWLPVLFQNPAALPWRWPQVPPVLPVPPSTDDAWRDRAMHRVQNYWATVVQGMVKHIPSELFLRRFFKLPQTQFLIAGTFAAYIGLLLLVQLRPIAVMGGGLITICTLVVWISVVKQELTWMIADLFVLEIFQSHLDTIESQVSDRSNNYWRQARTWVLEIQRFSDHIQKQQSSLMPNLLEMLHTTLSLIAQLADKLEAIANIQTETYRAIAQEQLDTIFTQLQKTHQLLQQLHDQMILLSPPVFPNSVKIDHLRMVDTNSLDISTQLRLVIETNRILLKEEVKIGDTSAADSIFS